MTHRSLRLIRVRRCVAIGVLAIAVALSCQALASAQVTGLSERTWYDGRQARTVWMASDRVAVVFDAASIPKTRAEAEQRVNRSAPGAVLDSQQGPVAIFRLPEASGPAAPVRALRREAGIRHSSAVFYQGSRGSGSPLVLSGEIIVGFTSAMTADDLSRFAQKYGVALLRPMGGLPNTYLFDARAAADSLALANVVYEAGQVALAQPNWIQSATRR